MKRTASILLLLIAGVNLDAPARAQEPDPSRPAPGQAPSGATAEHKLLDGLAGRWNLTLKFWAEPDAQPMEAKGSTEFRWILSNRFLQETAKCQFGEETFEWIGMYGYDDHKKRYTAVWVDNGSNAMEVGEGERDTKQKGVSYRGSHHDPRTQKQEPFRWLIAVPETDKLLVEMYSAGKDGKEFRVMEITGTRAK